MIPEIRPFGEEIRSDTGTGAGKKEKLNFIPFACSCDKSKARAPGCERALSTRHFETSQPEWLRRITLGESRFGKPFLRGRKDEISHFETSPKCNEGWRASVEYSLL